MSALSVARPTCAEDGCDEDATVAVALEARYEAVPPIRAWYVAALSGRHPEAEIAFHEGCRFSVTLGACARHVGELTDCWAGWLYGDYDPVTYGETPTDETLAQFGWTVDPDGTMHHHGRPDTPPAGPPMHDHPPVAGASDGPTAGSAAGTQARGASRKRARQARKRGRR